jgi:hypothetical protein
MLFARVRRPFIAAAALACLAAADIRAPATAQTAPQSHRVGPGGVVLGEKCIRRTDNIEGVVKVDACERWYCGRVDVNDITVLNPRFAKTMGCKWQLVEDKCKCVRPN